MLFFWHPFPPVFLKEVTLWPLHVCSRQTKMNDMNSSEAGTKIRQSSNYSWVSSRFPSKDPNSPRALESEPKAHIRVMKLCRKDSALQSLPWVPAPVFQEKDKRLPLSVTGATLQERGAGETATCILRTAGPTLFSWPKKLPTLSRYRREPQSTDAKLSEDSNVTWVFSC